MIFNFFFLFFPFTHKILKCIQNHYYTVQISTLEIILFLLFFPIFIVIFRSFLDLTWNDVSFSLFINFKWKDKDWELPPHIINLRAFTNLKLLLFSVRLLLLFFMLALYAARYNVDRKMMNWCWKLNRRKPSVCFLCMLSFCLI